MNELQFYTPDETARLLKVSPRLLKYWRQKNEGGPEFVRLSRKVVRYPVEALKKWLEGRGHNGQT